MSGTRAGKSEADGSVADRSAGFTLVELVVSLVVIGILVVSLFGLFITLVHSAVLAKQRAVALTLATNQMEYLKSLPYDSLIVIGGAIAGTGVIPGTKTVTVNKAVYTVNTSVNYVDDAYDNCGNIYSTTALKLKYCRGSVAATPTTDTNFADYKVAHVSILNAGGTQLASEDTQIASRVSETSSNTGALVITVVDGTGTPISGATVNAVNNTVTPHINASDTTDENGVAIIYQATPDSGADYILTASKSGYSTLTTIAASGSLIPTYPNQKVITQAASSLTMKLYPMTANSLVVETTNTSGAALAGVKVYAKGGYKKYTLSTDTSYYFDNMSGTDTRPTTDAGGLAAISGLVPVNGYTFCGDNGDVNCKVGATTYYLAAAVPYGGDNSLGPVTVPIYDASNPPATTYSYSGTEYVQKVRLMLTTSSTFPRVFTMDPDQISLSGGSLSNVLITFTGYNLSSASAKLVQGSTTYTGTGCSSTTTQLKCSYNLTTMTTGSAQLSVTNSAGTLTLPTTPLGGFNAVP
ncbi:MAG TPA: carboxypeptidase-like regulatory domain-containing protein [Candidatus Saccharimonadales bacterium]|nr:carboxypeptidase-like regulatory domain-containing protein [Candidatus Saccharimonadales bacterium]